MVMQEKIEPTANLRVGALLLLAAVAAFTAVDALAKALEGYSSVQVLWGRYFFFIVPMMLMIKPSRWRPILATEQPWLQIGRAVLPVVASVAIVEGLFLMPLADATAILFAAPLMLTVLSIPLLGERVGVFRWLAVGVGFIGVIIVARPGTGIVGWAALWPLVGALFLALYQIATRKLADSADPITTLVYTGLVGVVLSSAAAPFFWTPPTAEVWALFAASGVLFGLAHFLVIKAFYFAEVSALAPLNYAQVVLAIIAGFVVFGEFPDAVALFGMVVIVGAGLFVFVRERQKQVG